MIFKNYKIVAVSTKELSDIECSPSITRIPFINHTVRLNQVLPTALKETILQAVRFVGTLRSNIGIGTCFLCQDGKVITPLHVICDIDQLLRDGNVYGNFARQIYVDFVGPDSAIYSFKVKKILNHGLALLAGPGSMPSGFDFAILELEADATKIIGPGLQLDQTNHFGSAFVSDPQATLAISRPYQRATKDGFQIDQYVDVSGNSAASGGCYQFSQSGTHQTSSGDSGKIILSCYKDGSIKVYALNLGISKSTGQQIGLKVENILLYRSDPIFSKSYLPPRLGFSYSFFTDLHGFRVTAALNEAAETRAFLQAFAKAFPGRGGIIPSFVAKAPEAVTFSTHQMTHLGTNKNKTRFHGFVNNADPYFQALAIIIQKATSHVLQKGHHEDLWPAIQRPADKMTERPTKDLAFYVNMGFEVGECRGIGSGTSWVFAEDPVGGTYHIYPNSLPESGASKPKINDVWIDLPMLLKILAG